MAAVTIDLWHTLLYLSPDEEEVYMAHQVAYGTEVLRSSPRVAGAPEHTEAELREAFRRAYEAAVAASAEGRTVTPAEQLLHAASETGRDADPALYLERLEEELKGTKFRRAPGAVELLAALRRGGYHVGVISNTVGEPGLFLRPVLSDMGFDRYLDALVFSDELPWTKPAPEIFQFALRRLGSSAVDAVHIGDGWSDIEGARRAGYRGSVLFTGLHQYGEQYRRLFLPNVPGDLKPTFQVQHLSEVGPIVRTLLPPT